MSMKCTLSTLRNLFVITSKRRNCLRFDTLKLRPISDVWLDTNLLTVCSLILAILKDKVVLGCLETVGKHNCVQTLAFQDF